MVDFAVGDWDVLSLKAGLNKWEVLCWLFLSIEK